MLGFFTGAGLCILCLLTPGWRRFTLAGLVSPFATSIVVLLGGFILADMNPGREYGKEYIPNGTEHNPTAVHYTLWLLAVITTLALSAALAYEVQEAAGELLRRHKVAQNPLRLEKRER